MRGILLALVAFVCLTAFAPAPFPKRERSVPNTISLETLRGTWRVLDLEVVTNFNRRGKIADHFQEVHVEADRWFFVDANKKSAPFRIALDGARTPATIDFFRQREATPAMVGLVKRKGNRLTILYYAAQPQNRATNFENPPLDWWVLTLERQPAEDHR